MMKSSLDDLAKIEDIEVEWKSFELRPKNAPPMSTAHEQAYKEKIAAAWPHTSRMAKENFGIELKSHRWGVKSRLALEGAKFAEAEGFGEAYHEAMFKAHFVEDRDFGDRQVLADLASEIGLDRARFMAAIERGDYASEVDQDIAQARAYGITGVPATIIQQKYLISGAQPLENLQNIVEQVKNRESSTA